MSVYVLRVRSQCIIPVPLNTKAKELIRDFG